MTHSINVDLAGLEDEMVEIDINGLIGRIDDWASEPDACTVSCSGKSCAEDADEVCLGCSAGFLLRDARAALVQLRERAEQQEDILTFIDPGVT